MLFLTSLFSWNHIHPVLVHFSTALVPASLASDVLGRYFGQRSLLAAAWWMMLYGAIATPLTVFAGWMWADGFPATAADNLPGLTLHKWLGTFLILGFAVMTFWRRKNFLISGQPGISYIVFGALVVGALLFQGFLGGQMTSG